MFKIIKGVQRDETIKVEIKMDEREVA